MIEMMKVASRKSSLQELEADLDYELASLYDAMKQGNQEEMERSKKRLVEIHMEIHRERVTFPYGW